MTKENVVFQLPKQDESFFIAIGATFAEAELTADDAIKSFADKVGQTPDYYVWTAAADMWKSGYAQTKGIPVEAEAVRKALSRFYIRLNEKYGINKPTSPQPTSKAKAEQREKAKAELEALKAKGTDKLQAEIAMLTAQPSKENLSKASKLAKAVEAIAKAEQKDSNDEIKALRKEARELIAKCDDAGLLQDVISLFN